MQAATDDLINPPTRINPAASKTESCRTIDILEELLADSIRLRDIYKNARRQTVDIQFPRLHQLFDSHYKEQIQLVDVLVDRIRALNGPGGVFAGDFLHRTQFAQLHRGRASVTHLLRELIDAHEAVLNAALPTGADDAQGNRAWTRDFAVGQVVLTNDQQLLAVREQLMSRDRMLRIHPAWD